MYLYTTDAVAIRAAIHTSSITTVVTTTAGATRAAICSRQDNMLTDDSNRNLVVSLGPAVNVVKNNRLLGFVRQIDSYHQERHNHMSWALIRFLCAVFRFQNYNIPFIRQLVDHVRQEDNPLGLDEDNAPIDFDTLVLLIQQYFHDNHIYASDRSWSTTQQGYEIYADAHAQEYFLLRQIPGVLGTDFDLGLLLGYICDRIIYMNKTNVIRNSAFD